MRPLIATFLSFAFTLSLGFARKVEDWSYERLFKEADLVMIGSVEGWGSVQNPVVRKDFRQGSLRCKKNGFHPPFGP